MATDIKLIGLLTLENDFKEKLEVNKIYTVKKSGYRIIPFMMPMELADVDNNYLGKIKVTEIKITQEGSFITFEVLKIFSPEEAKVYTENFVK